MRLRRRYWYGGAFALQPAGLLENVLAEDAPAQSNVQLRRVPAKAAHAYQVERPRRLVHRRLIGVVAVEDAEVRHGAEPAVAEIQFPVKAS